MATLLMYQLGLTTPLRRSVVLAGATAAALLVMKPQMMFEASGKPRDWKLMSSSAGATLFPFWMGPAAAAVVGGVFL